MADESMDSGLWSDYGLAQMWDMVKDEDGTDTYRQIGAWQRMAALCGDQADVLQKALDQLMARWPPNPSSAAELFKGHVDRLIWSMRDSAAAAAANPRPLAEITMLLSRAKDGIHELVKQHDVYAAQERALTVNGRDGSKPVPPAGWRTALDEQARDIMAVTDRQIGESATQIRTPTPYQPPEPFETRSIVDPHGPVGPSSIRRTVPPPVTDLPIPRRIDSSATVVGPDGGGTFLDGAPLGAGNAPLDFGVGRSFSPFVSTPAGMALAPGGVLGIPAAGFPATETAPGAAAAQGSLLVPPPLGRGVVGPPRSTTGKPGGRRRRRSDPDDPWTPPTGGPSVLEPSPEPDHFDPGPNVIGIDR